VSAHADGTIVAMRSSHLLAVVLVCAAAADGSRKAYGK